MKYSNYISMMNEAIDDHRGMNDYHIFNRKETTNTKQKMLVDGETYNVTFTMRPVLIGWKIDVSVWDRGAGSSGKYDIEGFARTKKFAKSFLSQRSPSYDGIARALAVETKAFNKERQKIA